MSAITSIEVKLTKALDPSHLEVIDESYLHNVEPGRESHVRIVAISNLFDGLNLVKRHQLIYSEIQEEIDGPIHALSCLLYTSPSPRDRTRSRMPSSA